MWPQITLHAHKNFLKFPGKQVLNPQGRLIAPLPPCLKLITLESSVLTLENIIPPHRSRARPAFRRFQAGPGNEAIPVGTMQVWSIR